MNADVSSIARATRFRSRSSMTPLSPRRTTTSRSSCACSTRGTRASPSSGYSSRFGAIMPLAEAQGSLARAMLDPRRLRASAAPPRHEEAEIESELSGKRCSPTLRPVEAPHDAGRLRRLPVRARQGARGGRRSARAATASSLRSSAYFLSTRSLPRALPDLQ